MQKLNFENLVSNQWCLLFKLVALVRVSSQGAYVDQCGLWTRPNRLYFHAMLPFLFHRLICCAVSRSGIFWFQQVEGEVNDRFHSSANFRSLTVDYHKYDRYYVLLFMADNCLNQPAFFSFFFLFSMFYFLFSPDFLTVCFLCPLGWSACCHVPILASHDWVRRSFRLLPERSCC